MKNTQLYPFERNKYFYGKLLSVEDFNFEQKYMNDKRRLINRLVHGIGVVSGLNVVRVDETTVSVESGLAFDATGREIVVDMPVTKKLSMLNGYESALNSGSPAYLYLCIEYSEGAKGATHNIVSENGEANEDRIKEGYNLYLTAKEPDDDIDRTSDLYEQSVTVFRNSDVCIRHIMPRFANPDSTIPFRIEVEVFSKKFVAFSYDIQLVCLNSAEDGSSVLKVKFDEMLVEKTGKYVLNYELKPTNVKETDASATPDATTFGISYDGNSEEGKISGSSEIRITDKDITKAIIDNSYNRSMDADLRSTVGKRLYLARIGLVNSVGSSIIDNIENVPFNQYVANNMLLSAMQKNMLVSPAAAPAAPAVQNEQKADKQKPTEVASGVCRINLNAGSLKNKVFYSDEIFHGLGLGSVSIILGAETESGTIYGNPSVFAEDETPYEIAAKLDPSKGSFVIGILTKQTLIQDYIDVKWTAIRDIEEKVAENKSMKITIKPNSLVIKPRQIKYLEAICTNMTNKTVRWSVSPENGGEITPNGMYSAPNTAGVYEVIAQSAVYPEVKASIMVVVRDK